MRAAAAKSVAVQETLQQVTETVKQAVQNAASGGEAIKISDTLSSLQEKKDYLIQQATALYSSQKFQDVVDIAQHILMNLDKDSQPAMDLLAKAKQSLADTVQSTLKNTLGSIGGSAE